MRFMKILINSPNVCFRMLVVVESEYSNRVTKIEAYQGVSLVDVTIFDQILRHFFANMRCLFEYSYSNIHRNEYGKVFESYS